MIGAYRTASDFSPADTAPDWRPALTDAAANLIAKLFIQRRDVKAIQYSNGAWSPHCEWSPTTGKHDGPRIPWRRPDLNDHLSGTRSYGHYLLDLENKCKLFAFDVDLEKNDPSTNFRGSYLTSDEENPQIEFCDVREAWRDRSHPGRPWFKLQFKQMAHMLARTIREELDLPCAVAYSGNKGIHVYAFTGSIAADEAREGAQIVLDTLGCFKPKRGQHFFKHENEDPVEGFPNLSIEVFPKQINLDGKDLGNLMRLPLGRNLKSPKDPTFFVDMTSPLAVMQPVDPIWALTTADPWKRPGE